MSYSDEYVNILCFMWWGSEGVRDRSTKWNSSVMCHAMKTGFLQLSRLHILFSQESDLSSINMSLWVWEEKESVIKFLFSNLVRSHKRCGSKKFLFGQKTYDEDRKNWTISHNWIAGRSQWRKKKAKSINACMKMFYARLDIHSSVVVVQLCICVSSYSVNRLLNLLALPSLFVVVRLMALCKERYTWIWKTTTTMREKTKKNTKKYFFLIFRLNRKLCIFLCTKCTDAMHSSFLFLQTLARVYTQTAEIKNAFVFYRLCAPLNGWLYHMRTLDGKCKKEVERFKKYFGYECLEPMSRMCAQIT